MARIALRDELYKAINGLLDGFEVIGPHELTGKGIFYQPITDTKDLYLGAKFTTEPVKKFFLCPSEYLLKGSFGQEGEFLEEIHFTPGKRLIIGVRPCEARGLVLLDKVLDSEYKDDSYVARRRETTIVGLSCLSPDRDCFCASMGGSPVENRGMDAIIFLVEGSPEESQGDIGGEFIIEVITDKGRSILGDCGKEFSERAEKDWQSDKKKRINALQRKLKVSESLDAVFESDYWKRVSFPCIGCGACTFLCPTCHCFDLVDEERKKLRCYDGCAFADFTLEASGVNPRPSKKERYRQRVFHKFDYFRKNFGENLCVGCGRCIRHCPVKIDIAEIVARAPLGTAKA